jgi:hypothetical protein
LKSLSSHGAASLSMWRVTVHKYENSCRDLMPGFYHVGSPTILPQLDVIRFSSLT